MALADASDSAKKEVVKHRELIRTFIYMAANEIEEGRQVSIVSSRDGIRTELDDYEFDRLSKYLDAAEKNAVSVRSLTLAIEMFSGVCKSLYADVEREQNPDRKYDLSLQYTAAAYELASIAIEVIDDFTIGGEKELRQFYEDNMKTIADLKSLFEKNLDTATNYREQGILSQTSFVAKKSAYDGRIDGLKSLEAQLQVIPAVLDDQEDFFDSMKEKRAALELHKDEAYGDLELLAVTRTIKLGTEHLESIETLLESAEIPLLPIDQQFVQQLLGVEKLGEVAPPE